MHHRLSQPGLHAMAGACATGSGAAMPAPPRPLIDQITNPQFPTERFLAGLERVFHLADELGQTMTEGRT